jgi:hypothetical protein
LPRPSISAVPGRCLSVAETLRLCRRRRLERTRSRVPRRYSRSRRSPAASSSGDPPTRSRASCRWGARPGSTPKKDSRRRHRRRSWRRRLRLTISTRAARARRTHTSTLRRCPCCLSPSPAGSARPRRGSRRRKPVGYPLRRVVRKVRVPIGGRTVHAGGRWHLLRGKVARSRCRHVPIGVIAERLRGGSAPIIAERGQPVHRVYGTPSVIEVLFSIHRQV